MIDHRARTLFALLPIALSTGFSEVEPDLEPLKVLMVYLSVLGAPLNICSEPGHRRHCGRRRHPDAFRYLRA
jgi:hypothetical protein